jgi:hypothetical protein
VRCRIALDHRKVDLVDADRHTCGVGRVASTWPSAKPMTLK